MKDETLLPCPFCGSNECEAFAQDEDDCPYHSAIVRCFNCDAQSAQMVGKDKISRAIAAWNKRPAIQSGNSGQVPAGYVLVPVEPTKDMLRAGQSVVGFWLNTVHCYAAMLAAAPAVSDGWIPVSERMPEQRWSNKYVPLNLLLNGRTVVQGGFDDGSFWLDGVRIDNVTAWQPLPDAPKGV